MSTDVKDLVGRIRDADYAGPMQYLRDWSDLDQMLTDAASALEAQAEEIVRLEKDLRTVQNAAKTISSAQGTELQHLRENYRFDYAMRGEVESLRAVNSLLTERCEAAERERDALKEEVERLRGALTPFVEWIDEIDTSPGDYHWRDDQSILRGLKMGSFRRARSVLNQEGEK